MKFNNDEIEDLPQIFSSPRFATYLRAANNDTNTALCLYQWNLEVSSALIVPLQVCEVAARNGIVLAIEQQYGLGWHLSDGFKQSLPSFGRGYCPKKDFENTSSKLRSFGDLSAGKLVAELKFAFWENMLTKRHDRRLWEPYIHNSFPYADVNESFYATRKKVNLSLEKIRKLRNRIAHHEPIFNRNIQDEYDRILELIAWRSPVSANWVHCIQKVTPLIPLRPIDK